MLIDYYLVKGYQYPYKSKEGVKLINSTAFHVISLDCSNSQHCEVYKLGACLLVSNLKCPFGIHCLEKGKSDYSEGLQEWIDQQCAYYGDGFKEKFGFDLEGVSNLGSMTLDSPIPIFKISNEHFFFDQVADIIDGKFKLTEFFDTYEDKMGATRYDYVLTTENIKPMLIGLYMDHYNGIVQHNYDYRDDGEALRELDIKNAFSTLFDPELINNSYSIFDRYFKTLPPF